MSIETDYHERREMECQLKAEIPPRLGTMDDVDALEQIVTLAGRDPDTLPEANELLQQIFRLASDRLKGDGQ